MNFRRAGVLKNRSRTVTVQVLLADDLAGGVRGESQFQVLGVHADPVIADGDKLSPAVGDGHVQARDAGVQGVLYQLLDHAGGALDDLARGDLVDQVRG